MCLHAADDDYVTLSSDCYLYSRLQEEVSPNTHFILQKSGLLRNGIHRADRIAVRIHSDQ